MVIGYFVIGRYLKLFANVLVDSFEKNYNKKGRAAGTEVDWDRFRDGVRVTISKYLRSNMHSFQDALFGTTARYSALKICGTCEYKKQCCYAKGNIFLGDFFMKSTHLKFLLLKLIL